MYESSHCPPPSLIPLHPISVLLPCVLLFWAIFMSDFSLLIQLVLMMLLSHLLRLTVHHMLCLVLRDRDSRKRGKMYADLPLCTYFILVMYPHHRRQHLLSYFQVIVDYWGLVCVYWTQEIFSHINILLGWIEDQKPLVEREVLTCIRVLKKELVVVHHHMQLSLLHFSWLQPSGSEVGN